MRCPGSGIAVQAEAGGASGPAWSRLGELLLALLHLTLDPAACHLSLDLQVGPDTSSSCPMSRMCSWLTQLPL